MKKIIIIGAGASGMMAAIQAAGRGAAVTVLEQAEKPLKKLLRTGNGRCNLTNLVTEQDSFRGSDPEKRDRILKRFNSEAVIRFFRELGLETKSRNGWIYPLNDSAAATAKLLLSEADRLGVKVKMNQRVTGILKTDDGLFAVQTEGWQYTADSVIVSVGTQAGGIREGISLTQICAEKYGLDFKPYRPALTSLYLQNASGLRWTGVRCEASVRLLVRDAETAAAEGEIQLTEKGVSGIPVFQISRYASEALGNGGQPVLEIDFMPRYTEDGVRDILARILNAYPDRPLKLVLAGLLPEKLAEYFASASGKNADQLAYKLKCSRFFVCGTGSFEASQVCLGGISLYSLTDDLEAVQTPGLYFTGEAVDVDGTCGGYNLQWAWSSGKAAGCSAASERHSSGNGVFYA